MWECLGTVLVGLALLGLGVWAWWAEIRTVRLRLSRCRAYQPRHARPAPPRAERSPSPVTGEVTAP